MRDARPRSIRIRRASYQVGLQGDELGYELRVVPLELLLDAARVDAQRREHGRDLGGAWR